MKTAYYITGTSRGIGKALTDVVINEHNVQVYGFSRTQSINHLNYNHISIDLSDANQLVSLKLPYVKDAVKAILINNSGMLGEVKPLGEQQNQNIVKTHTLNAIAPTILTNQFLQAYHKTNIELVIINISSGAARHPVESWANYCSSKASLDMLAQVVQLENNSTKTRVFSVAPGIVDTKMQDEIRSVPANDFPHLEKFVNYKKNNDLVKSTDAAKMILAIIKNPEKYRDVILDVREL